MRISNVCIKDICSIRSGKRLPKGSDFFDGITPYPYIRARDIKNGRINDEELVYLSAEVHEKIKQYIVNTNDVVITIVGASVGDVAIVPQKLDGYNLTENAVRLTDFSSDVNPKYILYVLNTKKYWEIMQQIAGGSAQPKLGIYKIESIQISLPDIRVQDKIVDILSAYDNLIENNQKQIKLLEEAAQRLYKEWFIDLRFPGHESTPIHDGIPEGWSTGSLDDIAEDTGKNVRKENRETYSYYLPIDCLPKKSLSYSVINDISLAESSLISFAPGDILFGAMRPYFHKVVVARDRGLTRSTCFVMNAREPNLWAFLTMLLFSNEAIDYATKISVGTTMPYVRWKDFVNMRIVIPTAPILIQFDSLIKPLIKKAACLAEANMKLEQARDRLLPKLMSGEIEV